jgi:aminoglycoside adenylyltransferase-like protein
VAAVYLVGGAALDDFSPRQSNVDLVVVSDPPLTAEQVRRLARSEKSLARAHRPAQVWHTSWPEIADQSQAGTEVSPLETPLTRNLLRNDATAVFGPDWPVVGYDAHDYRSWCRGRVRDLLKSAEGVMLMRRDVTTLVLEAARLAQGAVTGRVFSKSEGGEAVRPLVPQHFRRILTDAVGYRAGAKTSMYWGPFERKYDARVLVRHLVEVADEATG